jgi:hypothetical protein
VSRRGDSLHAATAAARMRRGDIDVSARTCFGRDENSGDEKTNGERRDRGASDITPLSSISSPASSPGPLPVNASKPSPGNDSVPAPSPVSARAPPAPAPSLASKPVTAPIAALPGGSISAASAAPAGAAQMSAAKAPAPALRASSRGRRLPARPPASLIVALGATASAAVVSGSGVSVSSDFEGQLVRSERGRRRALSGAAAAPSGDRANASASNDSAVLSSPDDDVEREWRRLVNDG